MNAGRSWVQGGTGRGGVASAKGTEFKVALDGIAVHWTISICILNTPFLTLVLVLERTQIPELANSPTPPLTSSTTWGTGPWKPKAAFSLCS
jgi:hypothetical protein